MTCILADIGGTYIRLARAGRNGPRDIVKTEVNRYSDLSAALQSTELSGDLFIACTGTPDTSDRWVITNGDGWEIYPEDLTRAGFDLQQVVNDLEAACYALPVLEEGRDYEPVKEKTDATANQNLVLVGIGTGIGLAYNRAVGPEGKRRVQRTCGGHMVPACTTREQFEVVDRCRTITGTPPVYEDLISGRGLTGLYFGVTGREVETPSEALEDPDVRRLFHEFLGHFLHQAIIFGDSYGGIFLTGGVIDFLKKQGGFMPEILLNSICLPGVPVMNEYQRAVPVYIITDPYIGLRGLYERFISDH